MIADGEIPAPTRKATPEEEAMLERASAPTLRDLREAPKDLLITIEAGATLSSPDDGLPQLALGAETGGRSGKLLSAHTVAPRPD